MGCQSGNRLRQLWRQRLSFVECYGVGAFRNLDQDRLVAAQCVVEFLEFAPKAAHLYPHRGIHSRIEIGWPSEEFRGDLILLDRHIAVLLWNAGRGVSTGCTAPPTPAGPGSRRSGLKGLAGIGDLPAERRDEAGQLASSIDQFLTEAKSVYSAVLASPANMTAEMQERMRGLASRTDTIKASLDKMKGQCSDDLRQQLAAVGEASARQRWIALVVFGITLLVAGVIVNLTIRCSITGPILRVIHGVQSAADGAGNASKRMAESGQVVARDAQQQASYIEETSASLEEISATTRQNADRAREADGLMREATQTVDRATQAMNDLTASMQAISHSSNQVAAVLKSIDEIAFHTNILALNAAVEAARAGQAGAGFSVVADEVRSLAHRAAEAARQSAEIVEKTIADVSKGVEFVAVAHGAFDQVSSKITGGSQVVSQIAASSEEQSRGVNQIGQAVSRMGALTQNNAANAQQTAENASAMTEQVRTTRKHLEELVAVVGLRNA
ncbi:MAG TPA: methyl-accepting chemotaxis protein [Bryobacteraceae bacterium]|nr:methyl-accepting chemotaxis protein [Bryobacteraceae bacterium]